MTETRIDTTFAKLKDEEGHIQVPGFYDRVRTLTVEERQRIAEGKINEKEWLADTGAPTSWGEPEYTLLERLSAMIP